ncbi:MAG: hypothetical protein ACE37F_17165 [Nannocystaceae bacterium]|nr:hypothetical protein [bacterium]
MKKYAAAAAPLIASALALGCNAEVDRTDNFEYAFYDLTDHGPTELGFTGPEHEPNFRLLLEADVESHIFENAKIEYSRIEVGSCDEPVLCATMTWREVGSAHFMLKDLHGAIGLIGAAGLPEGTYDELRFYAASSWVHAADGWHEAAVDPQPVVIPLAVELGPERRLDVRVNLDAPASMGYDPVDGWSLDSIITVESVDEVP